MRSTLFLVIPYFCMDRWSTSQNLQPLLAGRKTVFENRRIRDVFEDRRKQFDAPDDEDRGFERSPDVVFVIALWIMIVAHCPFG